MTKKELYDLNFNEAAEKLCETHDCITTYETLNAFAIMHIENDSFNVAIHILEALRSNPADYYDYDYSMGTLETPTALSLHADLEDYCEGDQL